MKAKQRATGQEVWSPWRAQRVGAKLLGPGQFEQPHTALAEVRHPLSIGPFTGSCSAGDLAEEAGSFRLPGACSFGH